MSNLTGADDVVPESESYQEENLDNVLYERELARQMQEQAELRAMCIENGEDAEKFLKSNFGQYLLGQADLDAEQAKEQLTTVDPDDSKTIRKLQNRIHRARSLETWISSAIQKGNAEFADYIEAQQTGED